MVQHTPCSAYGEGAHLFVVTARDDTEAAHPTTNCDRLAKFAARVEKPHRVPARHWHLSSARMPMTDRCIQLRQCNQP